MDITKFFLGKNKDLNSQIGTFQMVSYKWYPTCSTVSSMHLNWIIRLLLREISQIRECFPLSSVFGNFQCTVNVLGVLFIFIILNLC